MSTFGTKPVAHILPLALAFTPTMGLAQAEAKSVFPQVWDVARPSATVAGPVRVTGPVTLFRRGTTQIRNPSFNGYIEWHATLDDYDGVGKWVNEGDLLFVLNADEAVIRRIQIASDYELKVDPLVTIANRADTSTTKSKTGGASARGSVSYIEGMAEVAKNPLAALLSAGKRSLTGQIGGSFQYNVTHATSSGTTRSFTVKRAHLLERLMELDRALLRQMQVEIFAEESGYLEIRPGMLSSGRLAPGTLLGDITNPLHAAIEAQMWLHIDEHESLLYDLRPGDPAVLTLAGVEHNGKVVSIGTYPRAGDSTLTPQIRIAIDAEQSLVPPIVHLSSISGLPVSAQIFGAIQSAVAVPRDAVVTTADNTLGVFVANRPADAPGFAADKEIDDGWVATFRPVTLANATPIGFGTDYVAVDSGLVAGKVVLRGDLKEVVHDGERLGDRDALRTRDCIECPELVLTPVGDDLIAIGAQPVTGVEWEVCLGAGGCASDVPESIGSILSRTSWSVWVDMVMSCRGGNLDHQMRDRTHYYWSRGVEYDTLACLRGRMPWLSKAINLARSGFAYDRACSDPVGRKQVQFCDMARPCYFVGGCDDIMEAEQNAFADDHWASWLADDFLTYVGPGSTRLWLAEAYMEWLGEVTGYRYRLPTTWELMQAPVVSDNPRPFAPEWTRVGKWSEEVKQKCNDTLLALCKTVNASSEVGALYAEWEAATPVPGDDGEVRRFRIVRDVYRGGQRATEAGDGRVWPNN